MSNANDVPARMMLTVLRNASGDCTNGGATAKAAHIMVIVRPEGLQGFTARPDMPAFKLVTRWAGTPMEYRHLEPLEAPPAGRLGWMAGGNYATSSDGRWPYGALSVHDRSETQAQYDANFD